MGGLNDVEELGIDDDTGDYQHVDQNDRDQHGAHDKAALLNGIYQQSLAAIFHDDICVVWATLLYRLFAREVKVPGVAARGDPDAGRGRGACPSPSSLITDGAGRAVHDRFPGKAMI